MPFDRCDVLLVFDVGCAEHHRAARAPGRTYRAAARERVSLRRGEIEHRAGVGLHHLGERHAVGAR